MSTTFLCPTCQTQFLLDPTLNSSSVRCPQCSAVVSLPAQQGSAARNPRVARTTLEPFHPEVAAPGSGEPSPSSQDVSEGGLAAAIVMSRLTLGLAVLLSVLAGIFAVLRLGDEVLSPVIAGGAVVLGCVAFGVGLSARNSRPFLASAATAVFLGLATFLFSIGSTLAVPIIATSLEVRDDRRRAENARDLATKERQEAADFYEKAVREPKRLLDDNTTILENIKTQVAELDNKRKEHQSELGTLEMATKKSKDEQKLAEGAQKKAKDEQRLAEAAHKKAKDEREVAEAATKKAKDEQKLAVDAANKANDDQKLAVAASKKAKDEQGQLKAAQKQLDETLDKITGKLNSKNPPEVRKATIEGLAQLGTLATRADYHLCYVIAWDPEETLRKEALGALEKVQPKLHPLAVPFLLSSNPDNCSEAIKDLPRFGRAGIPFIEMQFKNPGTKEGIKLKPLLNACVGALIAIAPEHGDALELLVRLPASRLAYEHYYHVELFGWVGEVENAVLANIPKAQAEMKTKIVAHCCNHLLLRNEKTYLGGEYRYLVFGIKTVAALGPYAESALPILKELHKKYPPVRGIVDDAIRKIEGKAK